MAKASIQGQYTIGLGHHSLGYDICTELIADTLPHRIHGVEPGNQGMEIGLGSFTITSSNTLVESVPTEVHATLGSVRLEALVPWRKLL